MAADDASVRPPVVLRIKLRYDDLDTMVQRFATNVGKQGLFLPTKSMQPVGAEVKFELRLANDTPVLVGVGRVKHVRPPDPANAKAAFGMAIELMRVTRESREVIIRMIERRRALGLPEVAIPLPEDVDSARRGEVETQPRADTSGIVRDAMAQLASAPVAEQLLTARETGPVMVKAKLDTGPVATAKSTESGRVVAAAITSDSAAIARHAESRPVPAPLAAEPSKPRRPRVADIIAKATELSGPLAAAPVPGIDDASVDVAAVIARARVLAHAVGAGELEAELAALKDASAAPVEIAVEAASAELARQLGGTSVARRERSARWVPPPAIAMPAPEPARAPEPAPEPVAVASEPEPVAVAPEPEPVAVEPEPVAFAPEPEIIAPEPAATDVETNDGAEPDFEPMQTAPVVPAGMMIDDNADLSQLGGAFQPAPQEDDEDDVEPLDEADLESTQIGDLPAPPEDLAERLDAELAAAEAEPDLPEGDYVESFAPAPPQNQFDDDEPSEEISDLDVLAEADAEDADLLEAHGEQDPQDEPQPEPEPEPEPDAQFEAPPQPEPGSFDFAARLDLGDDEPRADEFEDQHAFQSAPEYVQRRARSDSYDPPSGGYTLAESYPPSPNDPIDFDEPHAFQHVVTPPPTAPGEDFELESALEQLDVDLDDISARDKRPALPGLPPPTDRPKARPRRVATEDDGVLIDFDDDE